jgi:hypothetical protein
MLMLRGLFSEKLRGAANISLSNNNIKKYDATRTIRTEDDVCASDWCGLVHIPVCKYSTEKWSEYLRAGSNNVAQLICLKVFLLYIWGPHTFLLTSREPHSERIWQLWAQSSNTKLPWTKVIQETQNLPWSASLVNISPFTEILVKSTVFWLVTSCISEKDRRFGGKYCLHHQGRRVSQVGNQKQAADSLTRE